MKNSTIAWIAILGVVVIAGVALAALPAKTVNVKSTGDHQFTVSERMQRVRKILVRTNAVKKIVAMADARLLEQDWLTAHIELGERPLLEGDWQVDAQRELLVETTDAWLGEHTMTLRQDIDIASDRLKVVSKLDEPLGPVREYHSTLILSPDEEGDAKFETSLQLRVEANAGWLSSQIVVSRIRDAAMNALLIQEQAIREIVKDHGDDLIILPGSGEE